jgi:hypothetical protein
MLPLEKIYTACDPIKIVKFMISYQRKIEAALLSRLSFLP